MPRSKFTAEKVLSIIAAIELYGFKNIAGKVSGIDPDTITGWMSKNEKFKAAVDSAERRWETNNLGSELGKIAIAGIRDLLKNGKVVKTLTVPGEQKVERFNAQGDLIGTEVITHKPTVKTTSYPPPDRLMEKLMTPYLIDECIRMLEMWGYKVIDLNEAIAQTKKEDGLSEKTASFMLGDILGVSLPASAAEAAQQN
ncbi:MAG: hypothetical protein F6J98_02345 [Moorea sp. SIO4G2]|nr:hypothetical protein [Moorena sp. SIO4G2]